MPESLGLHAGHTATAQCKTCNWSESWHTGQPNVDLETEAHVHVQESGHSVEVQRTMHTMFKPIVRT